MQQKEITIQGKQYPVAFAMKTVLNFEEITNRSFLGVTFEKTTDRIALIIAAALTADEKADITVEDMIGGDDFSSLRDIIEAYTIVMTLAEEFFKIPEIEKQNAPSDKPEDSDESEDSGSKKN